MKNNNTRKDYIQFETIWKILGLNGGYISPRFLLFCEPGLGNVTYMFQVARAVL